METKFRDRNAHRCDRFMKKDETTYEQMCAKIRPAVKGKQVLELAAGRRFSSPMKVPLTLSSLSTPCTFSPLRKSLSRDPPGAEGRWGLYRPHLHPWGKYASRKAPGVFHGSCRLSPSQPLAQQRVSLLPRRKRLERGKKRRFKSVLLPDL